MARAAGLAAGLAVATVSNPAYCSVDHSETHTHTQYRIIICKISMRAPLPVCEHAHAHTHTLTTCTTHRYAADTTVVQMGSDSGQLVFVPSQQKICKGDTVKW